MIPLMEFKHNARDWLQKNLEVAPPNYGAILPPVLEKEGVDWQKRLFHEGWAGIHWPKEHGGLGLTPEHQSIWLEECARADV
ncbi:MAG: acyl-CoA dehydrogenase family protein, partial [Actinomycetota bacterium]|nr:acyl-CoA dehydrogenase family protein [Actinomycetota bacterium]